MYRKSTLNAIVTLTRLRLSIDCVHPVENEEGKQLNNSAYFLNSNGLLLMVLLLLLVEVVRYSLMGLSAPLLSQP